MKGTLRKTPTGWVIDYNPHPHAGLNKRGKGPGIGHPFLETYPVHPLESMLISEETLEVFGYEIEFVLVPNENYELSDISNQFARIVVESNKYERLRGQILGLLKEHNSNPDEGRYGSGTIMLFEDDENKDVTAFLNDIVVLLKATPK